MAYEQYTQDFYYWNFKVISMFKKNRDLRKL